MTLLLALPLLMAVAFAVRARRMGRNPWLWALIGATVTHVAGTVGAALTSTIASSLGFNAAPAYVIFGIAAAIATGATTLRPAGHASE